MRGARRGGATCKAVIVDRVDDFLYFGAVMLSVKEAGCDAARVVVPAQSVCVPAVGVGMIGR